MTKAKKSSKLAKLAGRSLARRARPSRPLQRTPKADHPSPRQRRLTGMEDNAIMDIEEAAIEHSDIAGEIAAKKVDLKAVKDKIAALMKREGKTEYRRGSVHVRVRPGHEDVSVQVKRHDVEASGSELPRVVHVPEGTYES